MKDVDRDEWHGGNSASPTRGLAKLGWQWLTRVAWKLGGFQVGWQSDKGLSDNKTRKRPVTGSRRCQGEVKVRTGVAAHKPGVRNISIWAACTNFLLKWLRDMPVGGCAHVCLSQYLRCREMHHRIIVHRQPLSDYQDTSMEIIDFFLPLLFLPRLATYYR